MLKRNLEKLWGGCESSSMQHVNAAQITGNNVTTATSSAKLGPPDLSNEQWQTLLEMLNNCKPSTNDKMTGKHENSSWIIDMGASKHMIGNWSILRDLRRISKCPLVCQMTVK